MSKRNQIRFKISYDKKKITDIQNYAVEVFLNTTLKELKDKINGKVENLFDKKLTGTINYFVLNTYKNNYLTAHYITILKVLDTIYQHLNTLPDFKIEIENAYKKKQHVILAMEGLLGYNNAIQLSLKLTPVQKEKFNVDSLLVAGEYNKAMYVAKQLVFRMANKNTTFEDMLDIVFNPTYERRMDKHSLNYELTTTDVWVRFERNGEFYVFSGNQQKEQALLIDMEEINKSYSFNTGVFYSGRDTFHTVK